MADITDISAIKSTPAYKRFINYLQARAIPTDHQYLKQHGIELAQAQRIQELTGLPQAPGSYGIALHYPNSDYATVKLLHPKSMPLCPKGILPKAYLPSGIDWSTVSGELIICESPLKALTWQAFGFNALSAGGVSTVYMARKGKWCSDFPHAAIESGAIERIRIAWDSDIESNHNVAKSLRTLARQLQTEHPTIETVVHKLPDPPADWRESSGKTAWGCDDARKYHGDEWFLEFAENLQHSKIPPRDELQDHLDYFDDNYVVCRAPEKIIHLHTGNYQSTSYFLNVLEASRTVATDKKPAKAAAIWLSHPDKPEVVGMTYQPGGGRVMGGGNEKRLNTWNPSKLVPKHGDVSPWLELIDDAVRDKAVLKLMIQCMAYQVQNRGARLEKLLYFVGREVGTGKSTQAEIMSRILGKHNCGFINRQQLTAPYNEIWAAKELAILDDVEKLRKDTWSLLKQHITSHEITVTAKYMPERTQENYSVFYITSNQADILSTDADERRVLMIHFEPTVLHRDPTDTYWDDFREWLDGDGCAAIAHYLGTYDLSDFNPQFHPPMSKIKEEAIESTRDEVESFILEFRDNPEAFVPAGRIAITGHELYVLMTGEAYNTGHQWRLTEMTQRIGAGMFLDRARPKVFKIKGVRTTLYYIPGKSVKDERDQFPIHHSKLDQQRFDKAIRNNIEKYPVQGLQS